MSAWKPWSSLALGLAVGLLAGCSEGAKFLRISDDGGVVVYPYKGENVLAASFRHDAIQLIEKHCPGGYQIVREGEARGRTRMAEPVPGAEEAIRERRWGIEFKCR